MHISNVRIHHIKFEFLAKVVSVAPFSFPKEKSVSVRQHISRA